MLSRTCGLAARDVRDALSRTCGLAARDVRDDELAVRLGSVEFVMELWPRDPRRNLRRAACVCVDFNFGLVLEGTVAHNPQVDSASCNLCVC